MTRQTRHASAAVPLALLWMALVGYASLYPFTPDLDVAGAAPALRLPSLRGVGRFDLWSNLVGYVPLGALLFVAALRRGAGIGRAAAVAVVVAAGLSYSLELLQQFVPRRVPSLLDFVLNTAGAAAGALLAFGAARLGALERWHALRERWFSAGSAGVIVLLLLWPIALLFPAPLPFALGQVFDRLHALVAAVLADTPWQPAPANGAAAVMAPLSEPVEILVIVLGALAPALLAFTIVRPGWRRLPALAGALALGFGATTLSTAMNFGPEHALAWLGPTTPAALGSALALGAALLWLPRRVVAGVALVVVTALVVLVAQASNDPYYASSLLRWEQGRFIRFHGLAQWIGWLWPYAAILVLLGRVAGRDT